MSHKVTLYYSHQKFNESLQDTWCGYEVLKMILVHNLREPCNLIIVKTYLCMLWSPRVNARCVKAVALIRRVCFYVSSLKWVIEF